MLASRLHEQPERSGLQLERELAIVTLHGTKTLEEVLVAVGRVELDELHRARPAEVFGELPSKVCLPGARWTVENQLLALPQQVGLFLQPRLVDQQFVGQDLVDLREPQFPGRDQIGLPVGNAQSFE